MVRMVVSPGYKVRDPAQRRDATAGETIDVPEKEARILKALGRAVDAPADEAAATPASKPAPASKPTPEPVQAPATSEPVTQAEPVEPMTTENSAPIAPFAPAAPPPVAPPRRTRYMRRDERAEEE